MSNPEEKAQLLTPGKTRLRSWVWFVAAVLAVSTLLVVLLANQKEHSRVSLASGSRSKILNEHWSRDLDCESCLKTEVNSSQSAMAQHMGSKSPLAIRSSAAQLIKTEPPVVLLPTAVPTMVTAVPSVAPTAVPTIITAVPTVAPTTTRTNPPGAWCPVGENKLECSGHGNCNRFLFSQCLCLLGWFGKDCHQFEIIFGIRLSFRRAGTENYLQVCSNGWLCLGSNVTYFEVISDSTYTSEFLRYSENLHFRSLATGNLLGSIDGFISGNITGVPHHGDTRFRWQLHANHMMRAGSEGVLNRARVALRLDAGFVNTLRDDGLVVVGRDNDAAMFEVEVDYTGLPDVPAPAPSMHPGP